jgi:hypothetical protein
MARTARDRLARTLRGDAQTAFSVELTARTGDLSLDVEGPPGLRANQFFRPPDLRKTAILPPPLADEKDTMA